MQPSHPSPVLDSPTMLWAQSCDPHEKPRKERCCVRCAQSFSCVWLFTTPWTVARQAPLSMGFSRQEHWSGVLVPFLFHPYRNQLISAQAPAVSSHNLSHYSDIFPNMYLNFVIPGGCELSNHNKHWSREYWAPALMGNTGSGSSEARLTTPLSISQYITLFHVFFYLKMPYLRNIVDSLMIH